MATSDKLIGFDYPLTFATNRWQMAC